LAFNTVPPLFAKNPDRSFGRDFFGMPKKRKKNLSGFPSGRPSGFLNSDPLGTGGEKVKIENALEPRAKPFQKSFAKDYNLNISNK
jgi:hypothetical protein